MRRILLIPRDSFAGVAKARKLTAEWVGFGIRGLRGSLPSFLGTVVLLGCVGNSFGDGLPGQLKAITERDADKSRFLVRNYETTDMTATIEVGAVNMKASVPLPHTVTVPAGKTVEAFTLTPTTDDWSFNYTNHYTVGSQTAVHDDTYLYSLPYTPGTSFKVTQGYKGSFSHTGPDEYAIDWKMAVGTPVHAAREGVVVSVKDHFNNGGAHRKYEDCANIVIVRHSDGTMAHYCHLAAKSATVTVGQKVRAGDPLAASGNTGFTSGPHLHFAVFKARNGYGRQTIPVKFRTASGMGVTLVAGESYRAADPSALARN
jgi:murein DD-endopeptidase MepM/ murein hydrolase activator NlpD